MSDAPKQEPRTDAVKDFMARINKECGGNVIQRGDEAALRCKRFSSGILSMDCALGGGWPFSRIIIVAGEYSTGKTLKALKAAEQVENFDHTTHLHKSRVDPDKFQPGRALFVDVEHSFDLKWAKTIGWNDQHHLVAKPEYSEQAIDVIDNAIRENIFDLIILDSLAQMTPSKEIEESAESWQMGLAARLNNKAFRRWNSSLLRLSQETKQGGPCLFVLNQFRLKLGLIFGDPRTLPGGKGQEFAASIIVYNHGAKVRDDNHAEHGFGEYGGTCWKNKTFTPKCNFKYRMALKDHPDWPKGEIDNIKQMLSLGDKFGLITKTEKPTEWHFGSNSFARKKDLQEALEKDPEMQLLMWRSIVSAFGGDIF